VRTRPVESGANGLVNGYGPGATSSGERNPPRYVSQKPSRRNPRGFRLFCPCFRGFAAPVPSASPARFADQRVPSPTLLRRRGQVLPLLSVLRGERDRERSTAPAKRSPAARAFSGARLSEEYAGFTRAAVNAGDDESGALRSRSVPVLGKPAFLGAGARNEFFPSVRPAPAASSPSR
jgi:hypothetical protein